MSFWTNLTGAVKTKVKAASKNRGVVSTVLVTVLSAAGVSQYDVIAPVATNIYCTALVKCES